MAKASTGTTASLEGIRHCTFCYQAGAIVQFGAGAGNYYELRHQKGWLLILERGVGAQETTEGMAF